MTIVLLGLGGMLAFFLLLALATLLWLSRVINASFVKSVETMTNPDALLALVEDGPSRMVEDPDYRYWVDWARSHGFMPDMMAHFSGAEGGQIITVRVWRNRNEKSYLATYTMPNKTTSEFISMLEKDCALTTTNSRDSLTMPSAPGRYIESFDGAGLEYISQRHDESRAWLARTQGLAPVDRAEPTDRLILDAVRRQMAYVKSLAFWRYRGVWWYLIRRNRLNNKPIAGR